MVLFGSGRCDLEPPPIASDQALAVLILRVLEQSQDAVGHHINKHKSTIGEVEKWFVNELNYLDAANFCDDQSIQRVVGREFVQYKDLDREILIKAVKIKGADILRRFRSSEAIPDRGNQALIQMHSPRDVAQAIEVHLGDSFRRAQYAPDPPLRLKYHPVPDAYQRVILETIEGIDPVIAGLNYYLEAAIAGGQREKAASICEQLAQELKAFTTGLKG